VRRALLIGLLLGCAAAGTSSTATAIASQPQPEPALAPRPRTRVPDVELFFKGDQPFARRGCPGPQCEEWAVGDVTRAEMVFSPDKRRFAYLRQKKVGEGMLILVRNLAGDPINEFSAYKNRPAELTWIDNRRLGYVTQAENRLMYVVHDAETGEVLAARSGGEPVWGPQRRHVAFVTGAADKQALVVDGRNVWPRRGLTKVHGAPVWSPDGHGLALVEDGNFGPRLVVLVEYADASGDLTWPIPHEAMAAGLHVFWAGGNKVVIGESALRPRFAADWERLR
jgi:hypothetical protein